MAKTHRIAGAVLAAGALFGSAAPALPAPYPAPGPGHRGTICDKPNTYSMGEFGDPTPAASPVDPEAERLIGALEAAAVSKASTAGLVDEAQVPERTRKSCLAALGKLKSSGRCTSGTLLQLDDGEIRQEWACRGKVAYMLFYTVEHGRITNIWAQGGDMPHISAIPVR